MTARYLAFAVVYLFALGARALHEQLKRTGRVDPTRRLVFALVFADMAAMWTAWFSMGESDPVRLLLPGVVRAAGLAMSVVGALLFLGALAQLRALEVQFGEAYREYQRRSWF